MAEPIKLRITTEYDDAAAKKALEDQKKLQQAGSAPSAPKRETSEEFNERFARVQAERAKRKADREAAGLPPPPAADVLTSANLRAPTAPPVTSTPPPGGAASAGGPPPNNNPPPTPPSNGPKWGGPEWAGFKTDATKAREREEARKKAREAEEREDRAYKAEAVRAHIEDTMQERLNDRLVREAARQQSQEVKAAVAAERQAKAEALRQGRTTARDERAGDQYLKGDALHARSEGHEEEAKRLERELAIRQKARELRRTTNMGEAEALNLAALQVDAEGKIATKKKATADESKRKKDEESAATKLSKEQEAEKETRLNKLKGAGKSGLSAFDSVAGVPAGGLIAALANPLALIAIAAGTAAGKSVLDQIHKEDTVAHEQGLYEQGANRRRSIASGRFGDTQGDRTKAASSDALENRQAIQELEDKAGTAKDQGFTDRVVKGFNTMLGTNWETSSMQEERKLKEELERRKKEDPEKQKLAYDEAMKGGPQKQIELQKEILEGHAREARAIEHKMLRARVYAQALVDFGDDKEGRGKAKANEAGDLAVAGAIRREGMMAEGLVSARSGAKDISQIVGLARGDFQNNNGAERAVREQTAAAAQHWGAHGAGQPFLRPTLRGHQS